MRYPKRFTRFLNLVNTIHHMIYTNLVYGGHGGSCERSVVIEVGIKVQRTRRSDNEIRGYIKWNEEGQCCDVRTRTSIGTRW